MIRLFLRMFRSIYFVLIALAVILSVAAWYFAPYIGTPLPA